MLERRADMARAPWSILSARLDSTSFRLLMSIVGLGGQILVAGQSIWFVSYRLEGELSPLDKEAA